MSGSMDTTLTIRARDAATTRLLRHCLALGERPHRPPARARLDDAIGRDLARLLVTSLTARSAR